jgi:hypothetical protein
MNCFAGGASAECPPSRTRKAVTSCVGLRRHLAVKLPSEGIQSIAIARHYVASNEVLLDNTTARLYTK